MTLDWSDAMISCGALLVGIGLYFVAWPLVVVAAGVAVGYIGLKRAA